jgi:hypothetical protein
MVSITKCCGPARSKDLLNDRSAHRVELPGNLLIVRVLDKEVARQKSLDEVAQNIAMILLSSRRAAAEQRWYGGLQSRAVILRFPPPADL